MEDIVVVLKDIEITNIKNVKYGKINFNNIIKSQKHIQKISDSIKCEGKENFKRKITAIYGQNGSGKTVLIDCVTILKKILSGEELQRDLYNYINVHSNKGNIKYTFLIKFNDKEVIVNYEIGLFKNKNCVLINYEELSYINIQKNNRKNTLIKFEYNEEIKIKPIKILNKVKTYSKRSLLQFYVNSEIAKENRQSYIFNNRSMELLFQVYKKNDDICNTLEILKALNLFGKTNLFVIQSSETGVINMNLSLPLSFKIEKSQDVVSGNLITMFKESVLEKEKILLLRDVIHKINIVFNTIIPGLSINIIEHSRSLNKENKEEVVIELVSENKGKSIPLKYESDGIKKILSMLSAIIAVYNKESICLVIDEIDSGIFEYLLGELLGVLQENIKGQLIITSHNLRILEKIHKENIIFTTSNEENRYIRLCKNKNLKNLRDYYLKTISLGGEAEELYKETSSYEIAYALRKAGRAINDK